MSEMVGKQLGNFFGTFLQYDANNNSSLWRECMRLKIRLDARRPLKRKKKICKKDKTEVVVQCKYERLCDFCFICGMLTHTERFCKKKFDASSENVNREWGSWLRAPPRRVAGAPKSKWLREDGDGDWNLIYGKDNSQQQNGEGSIPNFTHAGSQMWNKRDCMADLSGATGGSNLNSKTVGGKQLWARFKWA